MQRTNWTIGIMSVFLMASIGKADDVKIYREVEGWSPYFYGEPGKTYVSTSEEYSRIDLGGKAQDWYLTTLNVAFPMTNMVPYLEVADYDRNGINGYTYTGGSYFQLGKNILQVEAGGRSGANYLYRAETTVEYQYYLFENFYGKAKARYMSYGSNDVYVESPAGVVYYFGPHYVVADIDMAETERRGAAYWGTVKANFVLGKRWEVYAGTAVGQRLFDIDGITVDAAQQMGFITFAGCSFRVMENMQIRTGCSYSEEEPSFKKRSVDLSLSMRF